jgi:hypothetical protein
MKGLVTLVMKGRMQAIVATVLTATLALMVTPLAVISAAIVVLATLRNGAREGLLVALSGALAIAGLGGLTMQMPLAFGLFGLLLWIPAWMLASILGSSHSLARTLEAAAFGGLLVVGIQYLLMGNPAEIWGSILQQYMQGQFDPAVISEDQQQQLMAVISGWMPGGVAASWLISMSLAVLLGRWAQALLEKPGAFGAEFRELRFSTTWLILVPVLLALSFFVYGGEPSLAGHFYLVGMALFLLQGISVAHALVERLGKQTIWLFGLYFLLFVGAPHSVTAVAAAGYADGWLNFRAKVRGGSDQPPGPE